MNHRLELSVGDAVEEVAGLNQFQLFFDKVYNLYHASAKNHQHFTNTFQKPRLIQNETPLKGACLMV